MPSKIDNPFKERQIPWTKYGILLGLALLVTLVFVFWDVHHAQERKGHFQPNLVAGSHVTKENDDGDDDGTEQFPELEASEYPEWLSRYLRQLDWQLVTDSAKGMPGGGLTHTDLKASLQLGCANIQHNQKEEGNFNYQYNFVMQELDPTDSQVRNVGALWGLVLCYQHFQSNQSPEEEEFVNSMAEAIDRAIEFFEDTLIDGPEKGTLLVQYPNTVQSDTGTNAIFGLVLVDYISTLLQYDNFQTEKIDGLTGSLNGIINYLLYLQMPNKHFSDHYQIRTSTKSTTFSGYFDGESLLCLVKSAKYIPGNDHLIPIIEATAPVLLQHYSVDTWRTEGVHDSPTTKGFYQWSSMVAHEYFTAQWKNFHVMGDYCLAMAHWIIVTHRILIRRANTGYAYEGILSAYQVAESLGRTEIVQALAAVIDKGLYKLSTWQVGGPLAKYNPYLREHPTRDELAVGGIMNYKDQPPRRIDTTQHQMHAVMMAMEHHVYTEEELETE